VTLGNNYEEVYVVVSVILEEEEILKPFSERVKYK
jgi:hypothetical protein